MTKRKAFGLATAIMEIIFFALSVQLLAAYFMTRSHLIWSALMACFVAGWLCLITLVLLGPPDKER